MGFPTAGIGVLGCLPAVVVDFVVAVVANEDKVGVIGGSAVSPELDVVGEATVGGGAAADANLIAHHQGDALGVAGGAPLPAKPEVLGLGVEHCGEDVGLEGEADKFLHGQRRAVGEAGVDQFPVGGVVVGYQHQGDPSGGQRWPAHRRQRGPVAGGAASFRTRRSSAP